MRVERIQFLEKYAALAENLLSEKYGKDYTSVDVEKLAEVLIHLDQERAAEIDKIEQIQKQAQYHAFGFADEFNKVLGAGSFKKLAAKGAWNAAIRSVGSSAKDVLKAGKDVAVTGGKLGWQIAKENPKKSIAAGLGVGALGVGGHLLLKDD